MDTYWDRVNPFDDIPSDVEPAKADDAVNQPAHYARWAIEPITFIMVNNVPFAVGNVIKYVMRHDAKDGVQDLRKAKRYIEMLINQAEGKLPL